MTRLLMRHPPFRRTQESTHPLTNTTHRLETSHLRHLDQDQFILTRPGLTTMPITRLLRALAPQVNRFRTRHLQERAQWVQVAVEVMRM